MSPCHEQFSYRSIAKRKTFFENRKISKLHHSRKGQRMIGRFSSFEKSKVSNFPVLRERESCSITAKRELGVVNTKFVFQIMNLLSFSRGSENRLQRRKESILRKMFYLNSRMIIKLSA